MKIWNRAVLMAEAETAAEPVSAAGGHASEAAETAETPKVEAAEAPKAETAEAPKTETAEAPKGDGEPISAAAAHTATKEGEAKENAPKEELADLAKMSDEDWAKAVVPDPEDENAPKPDRTIITPMAKELREAGVQPSVMKKIVEAYDKSVMQMVETRNKERAERMKTLTEACNKEVSDQEWADFGAAYKEYIVKDKELSAIMNHTELGSNATLVKLIALAGAAIRVDAPPSAAATAGSSQESLESRLFKRTVPENLR